MATKIEKLQQQLETYKTELKNYEKAFLDNDGKIDEGEQEMLDSIRGMIDEVNQKLSSRGGTATDSQANTIDIPKKFEKAYVKIGTTIKNLEEKIGKLEKAEKLYEKKDKVLENITKIHAAFPKIEATYSNSNEATKAECTKRLDLQTQLLNKLEEQVQKAEAPPKQLIPDECQKLLDTINKELGSIKENITEAKKNNHDDISSIVEALEKVKSNDIKELEILIGGYEDDEIFNACNRKFEEIEASHESLLKEIKEFNAKEESLDAEMEKVLAKHKGSHENLLEHLKGELEKIEQQFELFINKVTTS